MDKIKKLHGVYAYYATGAAAVFFGFVLPVYKLWGLMLAAGLCGVVFFAVRKLFCAEETRELPVKFAKTGVVEADAVLKKGAAFVTRLNEQNALIDDETLSRQIGALVKTGRDIFAFVEKNPEQARQLDDFIDYYLPTALKLIDAYVELKDKGTSDGNIAETVAKITSVAETVVAAFYKQLDTLYQAKSLDISADINVLETILKREGLK